MLMLTAPPRGVRPRRVRVGAPVGSASTSSSERMGVALDVLLPLPKGRATLLLTHTYSALGAEYAHVRPATACCGSYTKQKGADSLCEECGGKTTLLSGPILLDNRLFSSDEERRKATFARASLTFSRWLEAWDYSALEVVVGAPLLLEELLEFSQQLEAHAPPTEHWAFSHRQADAYSYPVLVASPVFLAECAAAAARAHEATLASSPGTASEGTP